MGGFLDFKEKNHKLKAKLASYNNEKIKLTSKEETDKVLNSLSDEYVVSDILTKNREKSSKKNHISLQLFNRMLQVN